MSSSSMLIIYSSSSCFAFTKINIYLLVSQCICVGLCLTSKILLRYFVAFYFWISLKYLKLCPNKLWGINYVLYTSVKCRVWIQVQTIKIWAPNLNPNLNFSTWSNLVESWNLVFDSILKHLLKWISEINLFKQKFHFEVWSLCFTMVLLVDLFVSKLITN